MELNLDVEGNDTLCRLQSFGGVGVQMLQFRLLECYGNISEWSFFNHYLGHAFILFSGLTNSCT
ncbi:hypothetical protein Pint_03810 [Pistacia integerrima]|uniref:Uncharacterized protein n=1 Tax=Pistacia integerrima TaxID=434235 RepID=A0ACC0Z463_9ROSI|nr:hypothetical protein Pint_03810 [Pistacia integerrima]